LRNVIVAALVHELLEMMAAADFSFHRE